MIGSGLLFCLLLFYCSGGGSWHDVAICDANGISVYLSEHGFNVVLVVTGYFCKVKGVMDKGEESSSISSTIF